MKTAKVLFTCSGYCSCKGVAAELEAYHISELEGGGGSTGQTSSAGDKRPPSVGPPWVGLEVPSRVMASVYGSQSLPGGQSSSSSSCRSDSSRKVRLGAPPVGYVAHRDWAPPDNDDAYWCWKADREVADRAVTAIVYLNGPQVG
jgi:hypothetical protein